MTDHTAGGGHGTSSHSHHPARTRRAEFYTYFTLIFLFAIPLSALFWALELVRDRRLPQLGPFARAWREAGVITPTIFRP